MHVVNTNKEHWHIFLNPAAGGGLATKRWNEWYPKLKTVIPLHQLYVSTQAKHITELVSKAIVESAARYILIVGGDGALHEAVNGICSQKKVSSSELTLALLPVGTGNDWMKTYQIPRSFTDWLEMFQAGNVYQQPIGEAFFYLREEKKMAYFVNAAGLAFDAYVVRYANSIQHRWMGNRFFYLWAIIRCLFIYKLKPAVVKINNEQIENRFYTVSCGIGKYSGGGMQVTPHADPQQQQLAVTIAGVLSPLAVLLNTYRFYNGSIGEHSKVTLWHTKEVELESASEEPVLLEADGEYLGHSPVKLRISDYQLNFIAPKM